MPEHIDEALETITTQDLARLLAKISNELAARLIGATSGVDEKDDEPIDLDTIF